MIEDITIIGFYRYTKDIGEYQTRYYIGDESTFYKLEAIITFDDTTGLNPQHYTYQWEDKLF